MHQVKRYREEDQDLSCPQFIYTTESSAIGRRRTRISPALSSYIPPSQALQGGVGLGSLLPSVHIYHQVKRYREEDQDLSCPQFIYTTKSSAIGRRRTRISPALSSYIPPSQALQGGGGLGSLLPSVHIYHQVKRYREEEDQDLSYPQFIYTTKSSAIGRRRTRISPTLSSYIPPSQALQGGGGLGSLLPSVHIYHQVKRYREEEDQDLSYPQFIYTTKSSAIGRRRTRISPALSSYIPPSQALQGGGGLGSLLPSVHIYHQVKRYREEDQDLSYPQFIYTTKSSAIGRRTRISPALSSYIPPSQVLQGGVGLGSLLPSVHIYHQVKRYREEDQDLSCPQFIYTTKSSAIGRRTRISPALSSYIPPSQALQGGGGLGSLLPSVHIYHQVKRCREEEDQDLSCPQFIYTAFHFRNEGKVNVMRSIIAFTPRGGVRTGMICE